MSTGPNPESRNTPAGSPPERASPPSARAANRDEQRAIIAAEMERTAFQKKAVSRLPASEVLEFAIAFFNERGYRAGHTGRPNQVFVMGAREGLLPRVTGGVTARDNVGKPGTTLVTLDAVGEKLGPTMAEFHRALRAQRQASRAEKQTAPESPSGP
jgi:hypothetical protein